VNRELEKRERERAVRNIGVKWRERECPATWGYSPRNIFACDTTTECGTDRRSTLILSLFIPILLPFFRKPFKAIVIFFYLIQKGIICMFAQKCLSMIEFMNLRNTARNNDVE